MKKFLGLLLIFVSSLSMADDGQRDILVIASQQVPTQKQIQNVPVAREVKMVTYFQLPEDKRPSMWELTKAVWGQHPKKSLLCSVTMPISVIFLHCLVYYHTKFPNPETDNSNSKSTNSETK